VRSLLKPMSGDFDTIHDIRSSEDFSPAIKAASFPVGAPPERNQHFRLLKGKEVCGLLSISPRTLWTWQENGTLPYYKIGGSVRFKLADIEQVLRRYRVGAALPG